MLSRIRSVIPASRFNAVPDDDYMEFTHERITVRIPTFDYLDMGRPTEITATIRPGDRLN